MKLPASAPAPSTLTSAARRALGSAVALAAVALLPPRVEAQQGGAAAPPRESAAAPTAATGGTLKVCGDPNNLPFSNEKQEGFENKIAALIARELGDSVQYTWWPHRRGFVRSTLRSKLCDLLVGVPRGFDPVAETKPYYRSTYYFVTRTDRNLRIKSLDDPILRRLKIGVNIIGYDYTNTPPAHALGARGIQVSKGYNTFYDEDTHPQDIIEGVVKKEIDVAIVWGPLAGYFAKRQPVRLTLVALPDSDAATRTGYPFAYDVALGVRRSDKALRAQLDDVLARKRPEIVQILQEYNIPTLPLTAPAAEAGQESSAKPPR